MTETIQQLKEDIAILQEKLQKLEETKSPAEEAYKRVYGEYPMGEPFWIAFKKGYEAHQSLKEKEQKWDIVHPVVKEEKVNEVDGMNIPQYLYHATYKPLLKKIKENLYKSPARFCISLSCTIFSQKIV